MPRRSRHLAHRGSSSARSPRGAGEPSPVNRLRALVEEAIIATAALAARDDLERAAISTQRLGALSSGMWRALSRELVTAAERLDRSTAERLDDIARRAQAQDVEVDQVMAAGAAAAHLDGHRETLESVLTAEQADARRLSGSNLLLGFSIEEAAVDDDEFDDDDGVDEIIVAGDEAVDVLEILEADDESAAVEPSDAIRVVDDLDEIGAADEIDEIDEDDFALPPLSVRVWLFFWPAPLNPVGATIHLSLASLGGPEQVSIALELIAPEVLIEQLGTATGFEPDRLRDAITALGMAAWTAHRLDEEPDDEDDDDPDDDDEDALSDEEDQSLGVDDR